MSITRIQKELKSFQKVPPENCSAGPVSKKDMLSWKATIIGAEGTPYRGGLYTLEIKFPVDYPWRPPRVKFVTKIYHPNINSRGAISLDVLKSSWSPALTITKILQGIIWLMEDPNFMDPLVPSIAYQYRTKRKAFERTACEWAVVYAGALEEENEELFFKRLLYKSRYQKNELFDVLILTLK